jgi:hypothetical protein
LDLKSSLKNELIVDDSVLNQSYLKQLINLINNSTMGNSAERNYKNEAEYSKYSLQCKTDQFLQKNSKS